MDPLLNPADAVAPIVPMVEHVLLIGLPVAGGLVALKVGWSLLGRLLSDSGRFGAYSESNQPDEYK